MTFVGNLGLIDLDSLLYGPWWPSGWRDLTNIHQVEVLGPQGVICLIPENKVTLSNDPVNLAAFNRDKYQ